MPKFQVGNLKKFKVTERRRKLIELIRKNPDYDREELAKELNVSKVTVSSDFKAINEELNMQNVDDYMIHRSRIIAELEDKKRLCMEKLEKLGHSPHQGARWMEEWTKIEEKLIRIYGLYAPEKMMIRHQQEFTKEQKDASVNAALGAIEDNPAIIDITPKKLTDNSDDKDKDADDTGHEDFTKTAFKFA